MAHININDKWINCKRELPPIKTRVELAYRPTGIGGTCLGWESEGWMLKDGRFSIKYVQGLTYNNAHPTHWRPKN